MAEEKEARGGRRAALYGKKGGAEKQESPKNIGGKMGGAEMEGDQAEKPDTEAHGGGPGAMYERHAAERKDMHMRHEKERMALHGAHRDEHRAMMKAHDAEHSEMYANA